MAVRNTRELEKDLSPERLRRIEQRAHEMEAEILLSELRRLAELSQVELAEALGVQQPQISRLESEDDMQISTLRRLVKALGGKLRITVEVPGKGEFTLSQFTETNRS